jgi:hypothetical protein
LLPSLSPSPSPSAGTLLGGPLRPQDALLKGETIDEKLIKKLLFIHFYEGYGEIIFKKYQNRLCKGRADLIWSLTIS